jgi:tRNA pseudouridine55 synthase
MGKLYRAGVVLGATADTDDADGTITPTPKIEPPMRDEIERELTSFLGNIEQTPPAFSAAKVAGRRAYALARKGKEVSLEPRKVWVHRIDIVSYAYPRLEIIVSCGKGTYIRSLARDLGRQLGCGGYIETLRRLEIGGFKAADAVSLDVDAPTAQARLLPPWRAIQDWPPSSVSMEAAARLRQGRRIKHVHGTYADIALMAVVDNAERMVAIVKPVDGELQPVKVFPES